MKFIFIVLSFFLLNGFIAPPHARGQDIAIIEDIGFEFEEEGVGVVTIKVSEVVEYRELPTQTGKFEIKIEKSSVPGELEVIRDVSAFASPVRSVTSFNSLEQDRAVIIWVEFKGKEEVFTEVKREGNLILMKFSRKPKEE
jgi:hypothetical protein